MECDDHISACDGWCHTSHAGIKLLIARKCKQSQSQISSFKRLSVRNDTQYGPQLHLQISSKSNVDITYNLHAFVPPFTLYLKVENASNPVPNHFEKTDTCVLSYSIKFSLIFQIKYVIFK